jgi:hypothetical protein
MTDFLEALLKFFTEFTWKRLLALIIVLVVTFGLFSLFERYTSSFRLGRLQKAADLLVKVQEIENNTNRPPELELARHALIEQTVEAIKTEPLTLEFVPATLKFSMDTVWKFAAGAAFWCFLGLFQIHKLRDKKTKEALAGLLLAAIVSGIVGTFIPTIWWPWFHIFIYPWLFLFCVFLALLPYPIYCGLRKAKERARTITCINNLKQLYGAKLIWAAEHKKKENESPTWEELRPYYSTMPTCPKGGTYQIGSVGKPPTCSHGELGHSLPA